jgi:3'-5' exoribonuclease
MEFKTVKELEAGKRIDGYYIIKSVDCKTTNSNNKKYLDFTLGDRTGEINGKIWECGEGDEDLYSNNMLVKVRGTVVSWQNSIQLKIEKIREVVPEDRVDVEDFVPTAPFEAKYMYDEILKYASKIENKDIRNIVMNIIEKGGNRLLTFPAAKKNHHSVRSGLLYHVFTMLRTGEKISEVYTFLNTDLIYGGVILHDMAKLEEMDASELGIVSDYTVEGQLLGHIIQGVKLVENAARELGADKETAMLLQHMILSHHYEPEYGSPVKPMFPEAEILHYLDIIDARMFDMKKATDEAESGGFSDRIWALENRKVYKPNLKE